jgi:PAS domain S-box-containing protein
MAQPKPTSKRSRKSGKAKAEKLRQSERALHEKHAQLAQSGKPGWFVFENSVVGAALTDPSGQFVAVNPAYQAMLGYTEEELQRLRSLEITVEEFRDLDRALVEELLAGKRRQFQIEKQFRRKNGSLVWVRNSVSLVPGAARAPRLIMALSEDITERKESEAALEASQIRLRQVIDAIPSLAWSARPDGAAEFFNQRWLDYTGLTSQEAESWGWKVTIHADDLDRMVSYWQAAVTTGESVEIEGRLRRFDGAYRWFLNRAEPFRDESGQIIRWYGTSTDIDDNKRAEGRLQRSEAFLADGQHLSKTGTFSWSIEKNEVIWSEELYSIFGFDRASPVTLEMIGSRVPSEDLPMLEDMISRAHRAEGQFEYEHRIVMPDGAIKYIHLVGHSVHVADGQLEYIGAAQDVTERRVAEDRLRERELNLRRITETIPGMLWSATPDGAVDYCNRPWLDFTAMTAEHASGRGWATAVYPDDREGLLESWRSCLASGLPFDAEARMRRFDGAYRWFLFRANPLRDESGRIVKWYGTNLDIEDRKRGEEDLRARELSWRQIIDNIPGLVHTTDAMGEVEFVSRQTMEYFGKTNEELKDWSRLDIVHPDDLPRTIEGLRKSIESGQSYEIEHRCRRADGVFRWFQVRARPVRNAEGSIAAWYWVLTDIDDRKKAEEAQRVNERNLSLIVDSIPGLVVRMSAAGEVELANRQLLAYFGKELEDIRSWTSSGVVHPEDLPRAIEIAGNAFASGDPYDMEIRVRRHDGVYRWFQARGIPLRDAEGRILNWYALHTDIDDRKRVEEALRASELNARMIVDGIPGLVARVSPAGEVEVVNRPLLEYFGKDLEEVRNWAITDAIYPDDLPVAMNVFNNSLPAGDPFDVEHRLRRFDGAYRWFQSRGLPLRDPDGRILNWYVLLTDIEDRKRAEEALQSNERNLSLIINTMPTFAWSARPDGSAEFLNQHYLNYVGLPFEKLQGWGWTSAVHPDDLKSLSGVWHSILAAGKPGEAEARLRRFDGEYRWFLFRTNPMRDESGQIVKWYGTNTDIHDRKRAEAEVKESYLRLAEAQQLSKTGSFITDLVADQHNWSEETFRIFEFDSGTKVTVEMIRAGIHPEDRPSFDSMIGRAMTGKDVDFSFRFVTGKGAVKHIRGMARVIEHIVGRPLFIGALQDVTESKVAEEALNRARSDLAHVSRVTTLNALTASIAHEINQPLSGIVTNANTCLWLLSTDPPDVAGARETAQLMIRDGNRASDVIERLRTLYGKKDSRPESMDLNEATREVISLSLSDLQRNRIIVHHELTDDLPPVTGDRIQLQQVILNLIRNASDAMSKIDDRPRELLITTERDVDNLVRLSVKDVGVGFQPQSADKLFEAFYTTKRHGMGIGLNVSRSIIEAHHGRLWAIANDGPGATFSFSLPCSVAADGTDANRSDDAANQEGGT